MRAKGSTDGYLFELVLDEGQVALGIARLVAQLLLATGGQVELVQRQRVLVLQFRDLAPLLGHGVLELLEAPAAANCAAGLRHSLHADSKPNEHVRSNSPYFYFRLTR